MDVSPPRKRFGGYFQYLPIKRMRTGRSVSYLTLPVCGQIPVDEETKSALRCRLKADLIRNFLTVHIQHYA